MRFARFSALMLVAIVISLGFAPVALAQEATFLVQRSADGKTVSVWSADCKNLKLTDPKSADKQENVSCSLVRSVCTDKCEFTTRSDDRPPVALVFGVSRYNPTCFWVFDSASYRYVYRCY